MKTNSDLFTDGIVVIVKVVGYVPINVLSVITQLNSKQSQTVLP